MTLDLFADSHSQYRQPIGPCTVLLRGFALPELDALLSAITAIEQQAPFEQVTTPGGRKLSARLTRCGELGWVSDHHGYRYSQQNPATGKPWPPMPALFSTPGSVDVSSATALLRQNAPGKARNAGNGPALAKFRNAAWRILKRNPKGRACLCVVPRCLRLIWNDQTSPLTPCPTHKQAPAQRWTKRQQTLATRAAREAGFADFLPDTCLMNHYATGARMSLHQDKNERDFNQPIVSVSLGMTATFLLGGLQRHDPTTRTLLHHGDVVVWGGVDRLRFHGIEPVVSNPHPFLGAQRINLTFRKAG